MTGDRPTGSSYVIGAYIGTLKNRINGQDELDTFIMSADYHYMTTNADDTSAVRKNQIELAKTQIALGLDPEKVTFYRQSQITQTFDLHVILSMFTQMAELQRQPSLKEKLAQGKALTYGLMGYPVLMSADILIMDSDLVPVAKDQEAHVEIARHLAKAVNKKYPDSLRVPKGQIGQILVGLDGQGKSGKSTGGIFFNDPSEDVKKKVMGMYTDPSRLKPTDPGTVEGNPVFIYHDFFNSNTSEVDDLKDRYRSGNVGDVEVKEKLYAAVEDFLNPFREKYAEIDALGDDYILDIYRTGEQRARSIADEVIGRVRDNMHYGPANL